MTSLCPVLLLALLPLATAGSATAADATVERWAVFDLALEGPRTGNPFSDVKLAAELRNGGEVVRVSGFYDGDGVFRVRFMPGRLGEWTYVRRSSVPALDGKAGRFVCVPPSEGRPTASTVSPRSRTTARGSSWTASLWSTTTASTRPRRRAERSRSRRAATHFG